MGVLVVLSLVLITLFFREPQSGPLHEVRSVGATAVKPFQVAAERVVRPFRDGYGWAAGLFAAKGEVDRLRAEVEQLRQEATQYRTAFEENKTLRAHLDFKAPRAFPNDYRSVFAAVVAHPPSPFEQQQVVISAGAQHGIEVNDPVVNADGLVGRVTNVADGVAQVTLITDRSSNVSAIDLNQEASGLIVGRGPDSPLVLDNVEKRYVVKTGDLIVTEGTQRGKWPSLYPRGITIGKVTFVGQTSTDLFKRIQVEPAVDFGSLRAVVVLVPRDRE
ncbi:MAG TPA: rod shape-determining protein MreC [Gaiellaceae bacterium]|nr:rod shape-determining protein MreC [Gaiellaceae bacterium]